jgi:hypothetical protein
MNYVPYISGDSYRTMLRQMGINDQNGSNFVDALFNLPTDAAQAVSNAVTQLIGAVSQEQVGISIQALGSAIRSAGPGMPNLLGKLIENRGRSLRNVSQESITPQDLAEAGVDGAVGAAVSGMALFGLGLLLGANIAGGLTGALLVGSLALGVLTGLGGPIFAGAIVAGLALGAIVLASEIAEALNDALFSPDGLIGPLPSWTALASMFGDLLSPLSSLKIRQSEIQ